MWADFGLCTTAFVFWNRVRLHDAKGTCALCFVRPHEQCFYGSIVRLRRLVGIAWSKCMCRMYLYVYFFFWVAIWGTIIRIVSRDTARDMRSWQIGSPCAFENRGLSRSRLLGAVQKTREPEVAVRAK